MTQLTEMSSPTQLSELQQLIRERYTSLSKRLQQVARYILDNPGNIAFETIGSIATAAEVPPSTLIRFASAFGFSGFNEMKQLFRRQLVEETSNYTDRARLCRELAPDATADTPLAILNQFAMANAQALDQLAAQTPAEQLEQAVQILDQAQCIYVVGLRRSFSVASYLCYALHHLQRRAILIDGLGGMYKEQLSVVGAEDAIVAISFAPYAEETVALLEEATHKGARQIAITDSQVSPLANQSDVCFIVKEAQVDAFRSQASSLCLAQTLAVSLAFRDQ
ncbi:MurR/RpiR family transcriptional regulator [Dongshaea marina]|uniref:MurR/RpiR family transcriptional regulator n=1 Tax=Dongshaea marina TaxID=2047966 RepID=UPI001F2ACF72|nr:MurR/RpiR family transcriptional regulator [Dongshaea marina]